MEQLTQFASVPLITAVVYAALALYKYAIGKNEKWIRLIPVLAALAGVLLGIICFYQVPNIIPVENVLTAILIGGASGLAATGTNQIFKQFIKKDEKSEEATDNSHKE